MKKDLAIEQKIAELSSQVEDFVGKGKPGHRSQSTRYPVYGQQKNMTDESSSDEEDEDHVANTITYQDKATQTEKENTIEDILKAITTLCVKVDSMDNEIQKLKSKSSTSQQHDYKNAKLRRSEDEKIPEIKGDVGKLPKTHNICSITTAAEILYEEIKLPIQVAKIGLTKDMIIPEAIGQQSEIQKIEIPSFYPKRIIGISTIIQELANNYLNGNAIWSYYSRDQLMIYSNSRELRKANMDEVQRWILSLLKPEE
ncbi:hypothetical protein H5410_016486 [Solanum commersonii]|uniref:Uncharacterized protein n=1 Tax=Solanum commersonii TaxID=4109 RepID=A0A9J5ZWI1_SOLCO|nr:hypothetical protein H5410_016486 [Solanum commersonii]